ncbi:MAG: hypothetical protein ABJN65_06200 [Parasphingorhabdus sp.]
MLIKKKLALLVATIAFLSVHMGTPAAAQTANPGDNLVVCGNIGWGGLNQPRTAAMRAKLSNSANFGPGGTYSESTFSFVIIGTPTTANLAANGCNIWFSGYDSGAPYMALQTFVNNGGFVIAGCDSSNNDAACNGLGVSVSNYGNTSGGYTTTIPINPLTCDGGVQNTTLNLTTAGGASSYFTTGFVLARYSDASAFSLAITDNIYSPTYILTGDIDMFTTNNAQVTGGNGIISDQDKFIANSFKIAADKVTGVLDGNGEPSCGNISVPLYAVDDSVSVGTGAAGSIILNILSNDSFNGTPVSGSDVFIFVASGSSVPAQFAFDQGAGDIYLQSQVTAGTYSFNYQICLRSDPSICRIATVQVTVTASPAISILKSSSIFTPLSGSSGFMIPGEDIIYSIKVENSGDGTVDRDTIFIVDALPPELVFHNGDIDTGGSDLYSASDAIVFEDAGSGLLFNYATDVRYSNQALPPNIYADCQYTPSVGYDDNVTYICINPKGIFAAGAPIASFTVSMRAGIR